MQQPDVAARQVFQHIEASGNDEIHVRAIRLHIFVFAQVGSAHAVQQRRPLISDLAFEREAHAAELVLNGGDLAHCRWPQCFYRYRV